MKPIYVLVLLGISSCVPFSYGISNPSNKSMRILSRQRRYLVFPEGSSLQLVYCLTMPSLGMGRIFTIGTTAAMAWTLPHEPTVFLDKKNEEKPEEIKYHMEDDEPDLIPYDQYKDIDHQFHDYHNDYDHQESINKKDKYYNFENYDRISRPQVNFYQSFAKYPVEPEHWHIYRRTRRSLYGKLEKLLTVLNNDGRACILKMICEVSKIANRKGSFMEEILKVIFRIKTHYMENEDIYDAAANKNHNCQERYRSCPWSYSNKL